MIDDFCSGNLDVKGSDYFEDTVSKIDESTGKWTSTLMCTQDYCACPTETDFSKWNETALNSWNRTTNPILAGLPGSKYTLLYKGASASETTYPTFYDCYKHILDEKHKNSAVANSAAGRQVEELSDDFVSSEIINNCVIG